MSAPVPWKGVAFNPATESENRIHSDEVARQYGFRGGLVPGVTVYAYLVHPALCAWGRDWLERGAASVQLLRPLYDGAEFEVTLEPCGDLQYEGAVGDTEGTRCAEGRVSLPAAPEDAPARRGDPPAPARDARPPAERAVLERLREAGLGSLELEWRPGGELGRYLRDPAQMAPLVRPDRDGLANPGWTLGLANWLLSRNVVLGPWIHVESHVQHHAALPPGAALAVEGRITDLFERRGHEFVDLDVAVFLAPDRPALSARHRAIYRLRDP